MTPFDIYVMVLVLLLVSVVIGVVVRVLTRLRDQKQKNKDQYVTISNDIEASIHHFSPINLSPNKNKHKQNAKKPAVEPAKPSIPKVRSSNGLELKVSRSPNGVVELNAEFPLVVDNSNLTPAKSIVVKSISPIPSTPASEREIYESRQEVFDAFALYIDHFIRHRKDFFAPNYFYSVKQLESQITIPKEFKEHKLTLVSFLKSRPEFKLHSQLSFSLAHLTPYRYVNHRLYGRFQCNNVRCNKTRWTSSYSFCDSYQLCPKCKNRVYPYEQQLFNTISRRELAGCEETKQYFENQFLNLDSLCDQDMIAGKISTYQVTAN